MSPEQRPDIETLALAIAHSQITVRAGSQAALPCAGSLRAAFEARLPAGFDDTDRAVLHWIAEEGRRAGRRLYSH